MTLHVEKISVSLQGKRIIHDISFDLPSQGLTAIVGPNGAGKSTLLKACLGLLAHQHGKIRFWGHKIETERTKLAYVPQREAVDWNFPVSALEVVLMGRYHKLGWRRWITPDHKKAALHYLDQVGLLEYADRQIGQLSGGQQQRVFLARALAQEAKLYMLDEPLANVDARTEQVIVKILRELSAQGNPVLCVHHDLKTLPSYFDHVILLNHTLIKMGPVKEILTSENLTQTYGQPVA